MADDEQLKPIAPYVVGQIVGYVEPRHHRSQMCQVMGNWYVINTESRQEELAKGEISSEGLVTYLPMRSCLERHGRGRERCMLRPMFPAYMFVRCEAKADHWGIVTSSRGVRRLLGQGSQPKPIADGEVEVIRLYESEQAKRAEEFALRAEAARNAKLNGKSGIIWDFSPGEVVRIKNGPFAGFYAQLETAVDSHDRIRAVLSLFGQASVTQLSAFDIEAT